MKILLLSVNSETFFYNQVVIPFGLASLGTYVRDDGHTIAGIEMNTPPEKIAGRYLNVDGELLGRIVAFDPDVVAMSTYAENIHNVLFWAGVIKHHVPKARIILGGNHASYIASEIMETSDAVDFVVRFEGEKPFRSLCRKIEHDDTDYRDVPNLTYRQNGTIVETETAPLIEHLDELPKLARDFFEREDRLEVNHADIITARGCPFNCTFCNCNHFWNKRYRTVSTDRVIEELHDLKARYPNLKTIRIRDESVSIDRRRCKELCNKIAAQGLGLKLQAHSRLDGLDEEIIQHLAKAGYEQLFIGLESGSPSVLERLNKGIDADDIRTIVPHLRKYGISFRLSLMLATPGETLDEVRETLNLIEDLDLDFDEFYFGLGIIIYPGTTDCRTFLKRHSDFRWLGFQKLSAGYYNVTDNSNNVTRISHRNPRYDLRELYALINGCLSGRLQSHGETDYFHLASIKSRVNDIETSFGESESRRSFLRAVLGALDERDETWGIVANYSYYAALLEDVAANTDFKHFVGMYTLVKDERSVGERLARKANSLLFAVPENEITEWYIHVSGLGFEGQVLSFERIVTNDDFRETAPENLIDRAAVDKNTLRRSIREYRMRSFAATGRRQLVRLIKKLGLYRTALVMLHYKQKLSASMRKR